jgi:hypothetical protein
MYTTPLQLQSIQEEIQPILTALWALYNVSNCRGQLGKEEIRLLFFVPATL